MTTPETPGANVCEIVRHGYVICRHSLDLPSLRVEADQWKTYHPGQEVSLGRMHYELKNSPFMSSAAAISVTSSFLPVCKDFFGARYPYIEISTVQVVESYPGSHPQCFHGDNAERGLTFVLPLTDMKVQSGPTQLLTNSHTLFTFEGFRSTLSQQIERIKMKADSTGPAASPQKTEHSTLFESFPQLTAPVLRNDQMLIFDARLLHRGLSNASKEMRSIIVFRYDDKRCPPPSMGYLGAMLRHSVGLSFMYLHKFINMVS